MLSAAVIRGPLSEPKHTNDYYIELSCFPAGLPGEQPRPEPVVSVLSAVDELSVKYSPITVSLFQDYQSVVPILGPG